MVAGDRHHDEFHCPLLGEHAGEVLLDGCSAGDWGSASGVMQAGIRCVEICQGGGVGGADGG
ncbi:hypothetical protein Vqi01_57860 [Micromonospora qiuiae]|uniref:Uncharacterized protein n=1 Tax=Micromonospora qiuiae TaxID=502268 RepID=A0ABQ4JLZ6_9ACTN|nr:hypothetical protein Vqi01_57860 [Micromonospora qiuiae]